MHGASEFRPLRHWVGSLVLYRLKVSEGGCDELRAATGGTKMVGHTLMVSMVWCDCRVHRHAANGIDGACHGRFKLLFHDISFKPSHHSKVKTSLGELNEYWGSRCGLWRIGKDDPLL
jgi:hypothetical protein